MIEERYSDYSDFGLHHYARDRPVQNESDSDTKVSF